MTLKKSAAGTKMTKSDPQITREEFLQRVKNAIWTSEAFGFTNLNALKYINSGVLGYRTNADSSILVKDNMPVPITISMSTYKRHKKAFSELPEIYQDLRNFALTGFTVMVRKMLSEVETLSKMSFENMMAEPVGIKRQSIIDSIVTKVMPTQSAFGDLLKGMIERGILKTGTKNEPQGNKA